MSSAAETKGAGAPAPTTPAAVAPAATATPVAASGVTRCRDALAAAATPVAQLAKPLGAFSIGASQPTSKGRRRATVGQRFRRSGSAARPVAQPPKVATPPSTPPRKTDSSTPPNAPSKRDEVIEKAIQERQLKEKAKKESGIDYDAAAKAAKAALGPSTGEKAWGKKPDPTLSKGFLDEFKIVPEWADDDEAERAVSATLRVSKKGEAHDKSSKTCVLYDGATEVEFDVALGAVERRVLVPTNVIHVTSISVRTSRPALLRASLVQGTLDDPVTGIIAVDERPKLELPKLELGNVEKLAAAKAYLAEVGQQRDELRPLAHAQQGHGSLHQCPHADGGRCRCVSLAGPPTGVARCRRSAVAARQRRASRRRLAASSVGLSGKR